VRELLLFKSEKRGTDNMKTKQKMKQRKALSLLLVFTLTLGLLAGIPLVAQAATVDISGSHVIDNEDGTMTLVIKGVAPIDVTTNDNIRLLCTNMAFDFTGASIATTAPLTHGSGMNQIDFWPSVPFTIPTSGLDHHQQF